MKPRHGMMFSLVALGCVAGSPKHMRAVNDVSLAVKSDEAIVVFMRPSGKGNLDQAEVFDVTPDQPSRLVGLLAAKRKVAYHTTPGDHLFMVTSETADFMHATLAPGNVYEVLVQVRFGAMKARFSFEPIHFDQHRHLDEWRNDTSWVEVTQDSFAWASAHAEDTEAKRKAVLPRWTAKPPEARPELEARDGDRLP